MQPSKFCLFLNFFCFQIQQQSTMQQLLQIITQPTSTATPHAILQDLTPFCRSIDDQIQQLRLKITSLEQTISLFPLPQLTPPVLRFFSPSSSDPKDIVKAIMAKTPEEIQGEIDRGKREVECIESMIVLLTKKEEFQAERTLLRQMQLLCDIEKPYRFLCQHLKNQHLLGRLALIFTKCRQTVDSRLNSLAKKDPNTLTLSISQITSVANLLVNPELLNYLLFASVENLIRYNAVTNEVIVRKFEVNRTEKHLTLGLGGEKFNPKKNQEVEKMLALLKEDKGVCRGIQMEILNRVTDQKMLDSAKQYRVYIQRELMEDLSPILHFLTPEQQGRLKKQLEYEPTVAQGPVISCLLMRLKFSIQKADQIDPVCSSITTHLQTSQTFVQDLQRIFFFLQMCIKISRNDYINLGMYLIKTLLEHIQDLMQYQSVQRLLRIRQQLRQQLYKRMK